MLSAKMENEQNFSKGHVHGYNKEELQKDSKNRP